MDNIKYQSLSRNGNEKAFDDMELDECKDMHDVMGLNFVCGDGKIQSIETPMGIEK